VVTPKFGGSYELHDGSLVKADQLEQLYRQYKEEQKKRKKTGATLEVVPGSEFLP
jgi:hypothetical protein